MRDQYYSKRPPGPSQYLHLKLSPEDRALLTRLTHERELTAAELVRVLIREAAAEGKDHG